MRISKCLAGANAQQSVVGLVIRRQQVMNIVGGNQWNAGLCAKALREVCGFGVLALEAMVLNFKIIVPFSENLLELECLPRCIVKTIAEQ